LSRYSAPTCHRRSPLLWRHNATLAQPTAYPPAIADRAFPVVFAAGVTRTASFYEGLGFERHFQLPEVGDPGYVGLRRGEYEIGVVAADWPRTEYGLIRSEGVRFEMFVYVDDVDLTIEILREAGVDVLRDPATMPWGERVAYVLDPDGNPVALAMAPVG
jgi:lactoylglutathione lyase